MTGKQRIHASLEGKGVDRMPVAALYNQLYILDHFSELTGRPQEYVQKWLHSDPEEHQAVYRSIVRKAPFEILQPQIAPSREAREKTAFIEQDGGLMLLNRETGGLVPFPKAVSGHASDCVANATRKIADLKDVDEQVTLTKCGDLIAGGMNDYIEAAVGEMGGEHFILSGGVAGTIYSCTNYLGFENLFAAIAEEPGLVEHLCKRALEQNIEVIRALAAAGGDAIYIDDATATSDMISVACYERFSLPYMREMVREIHRLGQKAILIYFGGVMDRLPQLADIGAEGLLVEASMKNFVNDICSIVRKIGRDVTLFGNIDPLGIIEKAPDEVLQGEILRQAEAGLSGRGFIMSPASPITPMTPLARVQRFIELAGKAPAGTRAAAATS